MSTESDIALLKNLGKGWDGYNGVPATDVAVERATLFAKTMKHAPEVVPLPDGGINLVWFTEDYDVEVEITAKGGMEVYIARAVGGGAYGDEIEAESA